MRVCVCARVCVSVILCVLGCSCQPAEASLSIIKACHWLVHRFGQPIRDTDVRSVWKIGEEAVERKRRTWSDRLGLTVRTFQDFVYFPFTTQRHSVPYHQWCARISFCLLILFSCSYLLRDSQLQYLFLWHCCSSRVPEHTCTYLNWRISGRNM